MDSVSFSVLIFFLLSIAFFYRYLGDAVRKRDNTLIRIGIAFVATIYPEVKKFMKKVGRSLSGCPCPHDSMAWAMVAMVSPSSPHLGDFTIGKSVRCGLDVPLF